MTTPNLDQAAADFLNALREGSIPHIEQINEIAAQGYFVDGIGGMIAAGAFFFVSIACFLAALIADEKAPVLIASLITFVIGVFCFACSFAEVFAPQTQLLMHVLSAVK